VDASLRRRPQVEFGAESVDVRQFSHEQSRRPGQALDQGGDGHDPVPAGEIGCVGDVDDLELDLPSEVFVAEAPDRFEGLRRARGGPADVQRQ